MKKKFFINSVVFAVVLSICASMTLNNAYAIWPDCSKLNKNGQFDDESCAIADSVEKISNGEKFIKLDNVGRHSEYNLLFFDSSKINGILSNLTYNRDISQTVAMNKYQLARENEDISSGVYSIGIGSAFAVILKNAINAMNLKREDKERFLRAPLDELNLLQRRIQNVAFVVPLVVATGVSVFVSSFAQAVNNYFSYKSINAFLKKSNEENISYFGILRTILDDINSEKLNTSKILCLRVKSVPAVVRILDKKIAKDYSLEEQNEFNNNVKKLKEEIVSILTEANELE